MSKKILMINNEEGFNKINNYNYNIEKNINFKKLNSFDYNIYNPKMGEDINLEYFKSILENPKKDLINEIYEESFDSLYLIQNPNNSKEEFQSTENSTINKSNFEKKEDLFCKIINFKTILHHKRGRKRVIGTNKKKINKLHGSDEFDNIQRKIQVHFINFLIKLANDAITSKFGKKYGFSFKDIKYGLKKIVNHNHIEYLKQLTYGDIIKMKISAKNKKFKENHNQNVFLRVCEDSEELKRLFEKNYLYMYFPNFIFLYKRGRKNN